ncbi:Leucine aminopeptidase 1 [Orbilia javanica]|uniref:Peptide hydrolase n=1 Tax=Orbilia javanica TaxID=47235 RepID=A0AAN8MPL6_9PEZI
MKFALVFSALAASTAVTALYIPEPKIKEPLYTVELAPGETRQVTESEKWELLGQGKHFIDITDYQYIDSRRVQVSAAAFPASVSHQAAVKPLISKLSADKIYTTLQKFTSFNNRYYKSATGKESAEWLLQQVQGIISNAATGNGTSVAAFVKPFVHPSWVQNSIIATIPGQSPNTIVVGSHLDSVNLRSPTSGRAPGADDNGSGSMTILETLRALLSDPLVAAGQSPNTIEFHWYAGEEAGLLGSQAIFAAYKREGRQVKAMLNQDMTGYVRGTLDAGKPESLGVVTDNVDRDLTAFIRKVIAAYCAIPSVDTRCGYACSDHASALRNGYPSAFVIESHMDYSSDFIHGTGDTMETVSAEHMLEHAKMSLGFVYELAHAQGL